MANRTEFIKTGLERLLEKDKDAATFRPKWNALSRENPVFQKNCCILKKRSAVI